MKISLEQLVNMNYVKYDKMIEIVNAAYAKSDASTINIYIDMYSIVKSLYSNREYDIIDYSTLSACIINMCAHYREFFRTRYRTESNIFIVYSKNTNYINNQFYPNYNHKNLSMFIANKKVDDMIKSNIELLSILCPYLPDVHFVNGTFETGVIIYDLICKNELIDNSPHMVITKDPYNYQLVPSRDNVTILRPKKSNGQDNSYYINNSNLLDIYLTERKVKTKIPNALSPRLLSLIMTLSSTSERNVKSLFSISNTIKIIDRAILGYKMVNGYNSDTEFIWNSIYDSSWNIGYPTFENRFKAIDIITQHNIYINTPESKDFHPKNLFDPETVKSINNRYFIKTPLDLNRL